MQREAQEGAVDGFLERLWGFYLRRRDWPTSLQADILCERETGRGLPEIAQNLAGLVAPNFARWSHVWSPDESVKVQLTVAGMLRLEGTRSATDLFAEALQLIVRRAADQDVDSGPYLVVTRACLADWLRVDERSVNLDVVGMLLRNDVPDIWSTFSGSDDDWTITVQIRGARTYRGIDTAEEFVALRQRIQDDEDARLRGASVQPANLADDSLPGDPSKVFVVHGRDEDAKRALVALLESVQLEAVDFHAAVRSTGNPAPTVAEVIFAGFREARAIVVLFTPDEDATLRTDLQTSEVDGVLVPRSRPNVFLEAGMALISHPKRTVFVQVGDVSPPTDLDGIHFVRMDGSELTRSSLLDRLEMAGCKVDRSESRWLCAGDFESAFDRRSTGE